MSRAALLRLLGVLWLLAACGHRPEPVQSFRGDGMITSIVFFDPSRIAGRWHEVAAFRAPGAPDCRGAVSDYALRPDGALDLTETSCSPGAAGRRKAVAVASGPGRLTVSAGAATEVYWVLWVDEAYRTLVIGMPSGQRGFVLNRDPSIPADRLAAAREILDWNGYDLSRLVVAP